ncbi:MAG: hypothetical protein SFV17_19365 [Candidatus Obscuribacter sp.]|nr:hypothetical protein [Candidatus Obscuribacter sp.]
MRNFVALLTSLMLTVNLTSMGFEIDKAARSEWIAIADFYGIQPSSKRDKCRVTALFKVVRELKGPHWDREFMPINFESKENLGRITGASKYSGAELPEPGTRWIIFIKHAVPAQDGSFVAYNRSEGLRRCKRADVLMLLRELERDSGGNEEAQWAEILKLADKKPARKSHRR